EQNIDTIKDHLFAELMLWVRHLVENLCVLTGFDLIPPKIQRSAKVSYGDLNKYNLSYIKDKKTIKIPSPVFTGGFSRGYSLGCSLNDFETAVSLASDKKRPVLE